jgi:hypothetical protein
MNRAIALFLAVLLGVGALIPLATNRVQAESPHKHHRHAKHYKKYSKGWWRQYHARQRRKRALQAKARALRLQQLRLEKANAEQKDTTQAKPVSKTSTPVAKHTDAVTPAVLPSGDPAPASWKAGTSTASELQFRVDNPQGAQIGSASISVVGPSGMRPDSGRKNVGGVPTSQLRRDVIDKMIKENGWVVNDYQKEIAGQQVYVVEAQSQSKSGGVQSRMFYFTEVDGLVYSVVTNSPVQDSQQLAEESEKVIHSLKNRAVRPTQRASVQP